MNMFVAAITFVLLLTVALGCLLWAMGIRWPIKDPELLARATVGRTGVTRLPKLWSLAVSIVLTAAGVLALSLADHDSGGFGLTLLGLLVGLLFAARGVLGYTAGWRARFPVEPFATLDRRNYSPLALIVAAGFVILVVMRLI
ncbi:DUF3995 domain-containing protein [Devosia sp.]|uniref:DUF3995 domain-containing protein n=1 Tax=Devosia sp. TaxID=1871048 RepID=UPI003A95B5CD